MATITREVEVCDICRDEHREVEVYEVRHGEVTVKVALCTVEHAGQMEKMLAVGTPTPIPRSSPKPKVWTMEEIERLKAAKRGSQAR